MDDPSVSERVSAHRERMITLFCDPQTQYFTDRFGRTLPDSLNRLYSLREKLFTTFSEGRAAASEDLPVRDFAPLSHAAIDYCERYGFRYFSFGVGHDGEDLLVGFDEDCRVYVDWGDAEQLPEPVKLSLSEIVDQTIELIAKREQKCG